MIRQDSEAGKGSVRPRARKVCGLAPSGPPSCGEDNQTETRRPPASTRPGNGPSAESQDSSEPKCTVGYPVDFIGLSEVLQASGAPGGGGMTVSRFWSADRLRAVWM